MHRLIGEYKMSNFTTPFTRHRLVVRKQIHSQWSISTIIRICTIAYEDYLLYKAAASLCLCVCLYPPLFFTRPSNRDQIWHTYSDRYGTSSPKKIDPPHHRGVAETAATTRRHADRQHDVILQNVGGSF